MFATIRDIFELTAQQAFSNWLLLAKNPLNFIFTSPLAKIMQRC